MISPYPIHLHRYLKKKKNQFPSNLGKLFYMSFEDALWDILKKKKVKKGSVILLPEFWCGDVQNNIVSHGYKYVHYHTTDDFKVNVSEIITKLKKIKPSVLLIFHPFGITNNLIQDTSWLKNLSQKTILIEDCVHRLVDPSDIRLLTKNHLVMDSLRKAIPLQGSNVYGNREFFDFRPDLINGSFFYSVGVVFLWAVMQIFLNLGMVKAGHKIMQIGYDLIGDSTDGAGGWSVFDYFQQFVDYDKVKEVKTMQIKFYEKELGRFQKRLYAPHDRALMKSYPMVFPKKKGERLMEYLKIYGLMTKFELDDSAWSSRMKVIGLPVGLHLKTNDIRYIINIVKKGLLFTD